MVSHQLTAEEPLPHEELLARLEDVFWREYKRTLTPELQKILEHNVTGTEESERAEELLNFAKTKKADKLLNIVTADVPESILPPGCSAELIDIRIGPSGPDDKIYSRHSDIRVKIPRGLTILQWKSSKASWSSVVIYGHKKFTGGIGDEDDHQPENNDKWREYFIADYSKATSVVCMDKLNGEAAHISTRYIDGQFYLIVGSKNVHMLIRGANDINLYEGPRYEYAKVIAETVCMTLMSLGHQRQHLVLSFLHHTRCTLMGEILQKKSQHIVSLNHLEKPEVMVICMTHTYTGRQMNSLLAVPPHHLLDLVSAIGLRTAVYTVKPAAQDMEQKEGVRKDTNSEGEVFYYLDEDENTIGLVKVKTVWYVVLRALREKAVYNFTKGKKKPGWNISDSIRSTHKRFVEIQKWLKFSDEFLHEWQNLAENFLLWLNTQIQQGVEEPGKIRPAFPSVWSKFLRTTNQSDDKKLEFK